MNRPLILHCLDGLGIGGAERQLILLLRHIPTEMFDHVVCHVGPNRELAPEILALGIPVIDLSGGKRYSITALLRLIQLTQRLRPALIHADHDYGKLYARITSHVLRIPVLTTMGLTVPAPGTPPVSRVPRSPTRRFLRWLERTGSRLATDHILAISQTVREDLIARGVAPSRVSVVYRGLNLDEFLPMPPEDLDALRRTLGLQGVGPILINVARLIGRKGQDTIIRAMSAIRPHHPRVRLLLVGDGSSRERYRALAEREGVAGAVLMLGTRRDVRHLLQLGDVFVFPSLREGTGVALLEAMAMSRPCVVSDLSVFREVLGTDGAGLFVPLESPTLLARAVLDLLADPQRAAAMGRRARATIEEHFDIRRNALEFARLCRLVIASRAAGRSAEGTA